MAMTLFSLAGAMLLISKLVRTDTGTARSERHVAASVLSLTTALALVSGYAWFRNADAMPAVICALTLPFLFLFPGTINAPVRVMGILMVTAGAACLIGLATRGADDLDGAGTRAGGRLGPLIIFDDESRRQELRARVRACEVQLEIRMLQSSGKDEPDAGMNSPTLASLKSEVESISRMLETVEGAGPPTAVRIARLEARIKAGNIAAE